MQNPRVTFQFELRLESESEYRRTSAMNGVFFWAFVGVWAVGAFLVLRILLSDSPDSASLLPTILASPVLILVPIAVVRGVKYTWDYLRELRFWREGKRWRDRMLAGREQGWAMTWGPDSDR